ncbi:hypothetical protein LCGC14_0683700 [marine sediment metagenome]|uniref:Uncharacterized protein n=1 Tax=marine sediment metagenome TaxID=412755 RepID=A0A0F9QSI3_9ZZZZ
MSIGNIAIFITFMLPLAVIIYNKMRVRGKILGYFAKKDKSIDGRLCLLKASFVIYGDRAYDVYPDFVRVARFPMGWPSFFQELVPCGLWDEEDAVQKDWITLDRPVEGSLSLRAALDENWIKKLVAEAASEGGSRINWRKILPIALLVIGALGLISVLVMRGG